MRFMLMRIGWILGFAVVAGFFLPWVKIQGTAFSQSVERERLVQQLMSEASQPWYLHYFNIRSEDYESAVNHPTDGITGKRLIKLAQSSDPNEHQQVQEIAEAFEIKNLFMTAIFIYAVPGFALLGMIIFTAGPVSSKPLWVWSGLTLGLYFMFRYFLEDSFLNRTVAGIVPGIGLWLSLYGLLALGFLFLFGAITPLGKNGH